VIAPKRSTHAHAGGVGGIPTLQYLADLRIRIDSGISADNSDAIAALVFHWLQKHGLIHR
jgi:hypothetical protein